MSDAKTDSRLLVCAALNQFKQEKQLPGDEIKAESIPLETPPNPEMGDIGMPMFMFAKTFRMAPPVIAQSVVKIINERKIPEGAGSSTIGEFIATGPYVNVKLDKTSVATAIISRIISEGENYGSLNEKGEKPLAGRKVMVEYSSPNTNKPLHLGHMRNDALGESVSRILKKAGADVFKVNIINNRGIHICKSMLAYKLFHEPKGETPETMGMKGDHFVGQCYVEFDKYSKEHPEAQKQAEEMLIKWEQGDNEIRGLWQKMNDWTLKGVQETYERTGVSFDKLYFESETYLKGKDEILKGLEKGIFFKAEDGSVRVDVTEAVGKGKDGEDHEKVLLRKDGTSVYITQDIGTAISRHNDWAFNQMVYVVASEQIFHFKVLFYILKKLGFEWTDKLFHLSYGLVNLPNGRMKSREGTVVDADDLIDSLHNDALAAIKEKGREEDVGNADEVAEKVALAALHYYLLQVNPVKDMIFNPEESLSFNGNTGPYLQYMGARMASILRKAEESGITPSEPSQASGLLTNPAEWELMKVLANLPQVVAKAAEDLDPSTITGYIYEVAKLFSKFYQQCPILAAENENLKKARLLLTKCALTVMKNALPLVLVNYLDRM
ncbi:MAG: arginine--tRNA ligase [Treponema sp.]|nr:arginine--tRNA ligase [Treponema sp.]